MMDGRVQVVVLGAGFAGLSFCKHFSHPKADVTVIDRTNHHLFQPLLYQVATAGLSAPDIAQPIRAILRDRPNLTVLMEEVTDVNLQSRTISFEGGTMSYDYLLIALGGMTSYFGHSEWEEFAPGLKTLEDALRIRRDLLLAFEKAETEADPTTRRALMTIVVVGGGPTGVEMAGACVELARHVLRRDFDHIDSAETRVILIEGGARILSGFPPDLSASGESQLKAMGVEVRTGTRVKAIHKGCVDLDNGESIYAGNIIWAAGVGANELTKRLGIPLDRAGRIKVEPDLSVPGYPEVFAAGDLALVLQEDGTPVPGVSPAAMQMARHAAEIIQQDIELGRGKARRVRFEYWDKGSMATIGRSAAVALVGRFRLHGMFAWIAWLAIHLLFLIGFRNKVSVLFNWAYSYVTYRRGARIITGMPAHPQNAPAEPPKPKEDLQMARH